MKFQNFVTIIIGGNKNTKSGKYLSGRKSTTSNDAVDIFFKDSIEKNLVCFFCRMITIKKHILGVICTSERG